MEKKSYTKPQLQLLGEVRDITAQNNAAFKTDVPNGTPGNPNLPGGGILGSK